MRGMSAGCSRCLHAAVAVVCMTLCVVEGDTEGAGLVSRMNQMESEAGIPSEGFNGAYRPIPGFAMRSGATVIKQATKMQCEKKCTSEKDCRSFSYRMSDRTCIWSLSSLSFDPDFMFAVKSSNPNARSKFREFDGMVYRTQGWTIVGGVSPARCRAMCQAHKRCKAYSARGRDKLCLMGPKGVAYSGDFTYYEKRGIPYVPFPLLPPGAKFSCTGPMCPKQPKAVDDPTRDPVLGAMEQAAKSAKKTASADKAKALAVKAETAATIVAEKLKTAEEIEKVKAADREKLVKMETKTRLGDIAKLSEAEQKLQRNAADAEAQSQEERAAKKAEAEKERQAKALRAEEKRTAELMKRSLADGDRAQNEIMEKMAAKDKDFKALHEKMKACHANEQAKLDEKKAAAEADIAKEKEKKDIIKGQEELKAKEVKAKAFKETGHKLSHKKILKTQKRVKEASGKKVAELEQKGSVIRQEISFKEANEKDEKILEQVQLKKKREDEAAAELQGKADEAKTKANDKRIAAEAATESLTKKNEKELLEVKEQADKKQARDAAKIEKVTAKFQGKVQKKVEIENEKAHKTIEKDLKEYKVKQAPLIAKKKELTDKTAARAKMHAQFYKSESAAQKVVQESEHKKVTERGEKGKKKAVAFKQKSKAEGGPGIRAQKGHGAW